MFLFGYLFQEYESYYYVKFNKWPKISKRSKDQHSKFLYIPFNTQFLANE